MATSPLSVVSSKRAASIEDFRRLLVRQTRRCLARRRVRTIIDNLLDRARPILTVPPFVRCTRHQYETFTLTNRLTEARAATYLEIRRAAAAVRKVPQLRPTARDRAPSVYTAEHLRTALIAVADTLPSAFTVGELDNIFRLALPHFLPGVLDPVDVQIHKVIDEVMVGHAAAKLSGVLDVEQRFVLASKLAGASDREIAHTLGVSPRTATNRKLVVFAVIEETLVPLEPDARAACMELLRPALQDSLIQSQLGNR